MVSFNPVKLYMCGRKVEGRGFRDREVGSHTSYTNSRPYVDLDGGFFGHFIAALDFDGPVDGAEDGVAVVCVCCGAVGAVQRGEEGFWCHFVRVYTSCTP